MAEICEYCKHEYNGNGCVGYFIIKGQKYERIKFGDESDDWGKDTGSCPDCAVKVGQIHHWECDIERCPKCDGQALGCECHDEFIFEY